jgi:hypothetical protein
LTGLDLGFAGQVLGHRIHSGNTNQATAGPGFIQMSVLPERHDAALPFRDDASFEPAIDLLGEFTVADREVLGAVVELP